MPTNEGKAMTIDIEIYQGSMNVYADLGYPDAEEMLIKAQLVAQIQTAIKTRDWTQQDAAKMLGLTQPKLSNMLRGQFRGISEAKLMACLSRLGHRVQIVVSRDIQPVRPVELVFVGADHGLYEGN